MPTEVSGGKRSRLTRWQIVVMRSLLMRGGATRPITVSPKHRKPTLPLWRRGIVEIWYRQSPDSAAALQGPFYGLTISGAQLAANFINKNPAPRGLSGAEQ